MKINRNTKGTYLISGTIHIITYKCPKCGTTLYMNELEAKNYCPNCGVKLEFDKKKK